MKNYLIVGGSSGIGLALTKKLLEQGHQVFSTYNKTEPKGLTGNYSHLDVMSDDFDLSFLPEVIDGFIYCPGSINLLPFARIKAENFLDDFQLQVVGGIQILQKILLNLKKSENAGVLFFSTVAVQTGFNFHSQVAASKGALEGLTRSLAAEFAPKIRVNAIAPSITDTRLASKFLSSEEKVKSNADRHPLKRIGKAEDVASMAAYLLSEEATWITGQVLKMDGGISTLKI